MTVEASLFLALKDLVGSRMYRDIAPANVTALPRGTFQQVGGESINFLDGTAPGLHLPRIQVNFWAATRDEANALARQGEAALRAYSSLQTTVLGEFVAIYEEETKLFGTMQDFQVAHAT